MLSLIGRYRDMEMRLQAQMAAMRTDIINTLFKAPDGSQALGATIHPQVSMATMGKASLLKHLGSADLTHLTAESSTWATASGQPPAAAAVPMAVTVAPPAAVAPAQVIDVNAITRHLQASRSRDSSVL